MHEPGHGRIRETVMDKISETSKRKKKKENDYANAQVQAPPSVMNFCTGDQILNVGVTFPKTSTVANRPLPLCMEQSDFFVPHVDAGTQP